jgi:hypothetical protein
MVYARDDKPFSERGQRLGNGKHRRQEKEPDDVPDPWELDFRDDEDHSEEEDSDASDEEM